MREREKIWKRYNVTKYYTRKMLIDKKFDVCNVCNVFLKTSP